MIEKLEEINEYWRRYEKDLLKFDCWENKTKQQSEMKQSKLLNYSIKLKLKNNTIKEIEEIKEFDVLCWKLKLQESHQNRKSKV